MHNFPNMDFVGTRDMGPPSTFANFPNMDLARFIDAVLRPSLKPPSPSEGAAALGRWGEVAAARHLRRAGYRILYRNFRARGGGEVDLICRDRREHTLVFVEVKTRRSEQFGRGMDAIDDTKRRLITKGAMAWLRLLEMPDVPFRFDVVEIIIEPTLEIELTRNAFNLPAPTIY